MANKERERFEKTVQALMKVMTKRSLAQLVAAFLILEDENARYNNKANQKENGQEVEKD